MKKEGLLLGPYVLALGAKELRAAAPALGGAPLVSRLAFPADCDFYQFSVSFRKLTHMKSPEPRIMNDFY
jgi:hypothetical protein